ncbi:MAG: FHA domain-containing protein [Bdellovibrionales bacterium]
MAHIVVRLHGDEVGRLALEPGGEYVAGRAKDCHIRLDSQRGISRQHLKFYERDGVWICETLSKFVMIQRGTEEKEVIELSEACVFSVPPYEFHFEPDMAKEVDSPLEIEDSNPSAQSLPSPQPPAEITAPRPNNEATVAGNAALAPFLRISYPNTADDEILKLEGQLWVAGRDRGCEIFVDSPHVSRAHFELARTQEGFFLTDLGSSNGTRINGQRIPPHEPTRLESGDEIQVMNVAMTFEIRDPQFANRLDNLPVPAFDPMMMEAFALPGRNVPTGAFDRTVLPKREREHEIPSLKDWHKLRPHHLRRVNWRKHKVRVALLVLIPILLVVAFTPEPKKEKAPDPAGESVSFDKLSLEQKSVVKDSFGLARSFYVRGKYALCLTELAKLHQLIPQFENSKELNAFCEQGLELQRRQEDLERKEREKAMIEQQINGYAETCKAKLKAFASVEETRQCLSEAIVLAPEHPLIVEMLDNARLREEEQNHLAQMKAETDAKARQGESHYARAKSLYKKGLLAKAIQEYEDFISKPYPRSTDEKAQAKREITSIRKELQTKIASLLDQCKGLGEKGQFKEAYLACDKAVAEDSSNSDAKAMREKMLNSLRKEMRVIYQDSVLEEGLGNVDGAKEKWRKIIKENLEFDEYTKKARTMLQKYEGGL